MKRLSLVLVIISVAPISSSIASPRASNPEASPSRQTPLATTIRGRAVCLDESGLPAAARPDCATFSLEAAGGRLYRFAPADPMIEMFKDPRVLERSLQISGRLRADGVIEIARVQSIKKEGNVFDLYYYCDICNITTNAMGPCPCCRKELLFMETPAKPEEAGNE